MASHAPYCRPYAVWRQLCRNPTTTTTYISTLHPSRAELHHRHHLPFLRLAKKMYRLATSKIPIPKPDSRSLPTHSHDIKSTHLPCPAVHNVTAPPAWHTSLSPLTRRILLVLATLLSFTVWLIFIDQPWIWSMYIWKTPRRAEYLAEEPIFYRQGFQSSAVGDERYVTAA